MPQHADGTTAPPPEQSDPAATASGPDRSTSTGDAPVDAVDRVASDPRPEQDDAPWRRAASSALAVWLASNVTYLLVTLLVWRNDGPARTPLLKIYQYWLRSDAGFYVDIADKWYGSKFELYAWFPLYPILVRGTNLVLPGGTVVAALAVSQVCAFTVLLLMHRLTEHEFGTQVARRATAYLAAFPMAFFLFAGYNASLFVACALGSLYCARRGRWWVAGLCGALASGTRTFGVLLLLPLAVEYLRQHDWRPWRTRLDGLSLGLVPTGFVAYAGYCWYSAGDPLAFSKAQDSWYRTYDWPGRVFWTAYTYLDDHVQGDPNGVLGLLELGTFALAITALVLCVVGPWRFRRDQYYLVAYAALLLTLFASTQVGFYRPLASTPRFMLEVTPIFMVAGRIGGGQIFDRLYLMAGVAMQTAFLLVFLDGGFVA